MDGIARPTTDGLGSAAAGPEAQRDWTIAACPECGAPAEVESRGSVNATDGPVALVKVQCLFRHWFLMPAAMLH
jgi:hypothetical protein